MVASAPNEQAAPRDIRHNDLRSLSLMVGSGYRSVGTVLDGAATVARGRFDLQEVRPGLLVHASDARHERTVTTHLLKQPGLNFSIVLKGGWQATLGRTSLACGGAAPQAMAFVLAEADVWQKHASRGGHARMVNVMASAEWLEGSGLDGSDLGAASVGALSRRHRWHGQWRPSSRIMALANQILSRPIYAGALQRLYLESRAIDIALESLSFLNGATPSPGATYNAANYKRMQLVRERLDDGTGDVPSLADLARDVGLGARTLQRQFATVHGVGVLEYARRQRLNLARQLLEREGVTVAQAAHRAGYAHPANFATAFRRQFSLLPSQIRARL